MSFSLQSHYHFHPFHPKSTLEYKEMSFSLHSAIILQCKASAYLCLVRQSRVSSEQPGYFSVTNTIIKRVRKIILFKPRQFINGLVTCSWQIEIVDQSTHFQIIDVVTITSAVIVVQELWYHLPETCRLYILQCNGRKSVPVRFLFLLPFRTVFSVHLVQEIAWGYIQFLHICRIDYILTKQQSITGHPIAAWNITERTRKIFVHIPSFQEIRWRALAQFFLENCIHTVVLISKWGHREAMVQRLAENITAECLHMIQAIDLHYVWLSLTYTSPPSILIVKIPCIRIPHNVEQFMRIVRTCPEMTVRRHFTVSDGSAFCR